jgi:IPT/TIG domain-containing protein
MSVWAWKPCARPRRACQRSKHALAMRPYPWYEINGLTRELEPYALYAYRRVHFERCYQSEPDIQLSPLSAYAGSAGFTLTVAGVNFVSGATVLFAGNSAATTFVSAQSLTATILAAWITAAGVVQVQVRNPNSDLSNLVDFTILSGRRRRVSALEDSITGDEERYGWMSGDVIMREIVHELQYDPDALIKRAQINKEYMTGFRGRPYIDQARIHMMNACLVLGETYEDAAITKRLLKLKTLDLWALSWLRNEGNFSPSAPELKATFKRLPPMMVEKFHWPEVFSDLGLSDLPEFGKQTHKPGPGVFSWTMRSDPRITRLVPEHREDVASLLDASMRSIYSIVSAKVLEACSRVPPRLPR